MIGCDNDFKTILRMTMLSGQQRFDKRLPESSYVRPSLYQHYSQDHVKVIQENEIPMINRMIQSIHEMDFMGV
jgi:hypothetical protein